MSLPYPPGPAEVPKDFTRPTREYRMQVALVLGSLLISFLVYLTMLAGAAWLCYWLVTAPWPNDTRGSGTFFRIVGIVCSALLFLYLLKGLFKSQKFNESLFLEIKESDQPELFAFIRRICAETRAPLPRKVFVSPEVNAAVLNNTSILSLVWPTSRDLLIGLGLVNMVNLSEFKAVLAHEFGHFSQKSMKLGSYVYVANKVMIDIVYGRDWLDHLMSQIKGIDLRIAIFVWAFLGVLWVLRKVLEGVFKVINLFNLSLMRHMEFNADRMAVSVAGSDAVVHCLLRSAFADQAFLHVRNDLWAAADHDLYTRDLFAHQIPAAEMIRRRAKNPQLGLPPAERGPNMEVFKPEEGDAGIPLMWSTHPPNHDRERNAKAIYLFAEIDERSPWLLFRDKDQLRFLVTQRYYEEMHKPARSPRYSDSERVQNFFNEEFAETTYPDRFQGFYDNRYLELDDFDATLKHARTQPDEPDESPTKLASLHGPDLKLWVEAHNKRLTDIDFFQALANGHIKPRKKVLEFRGESYSPSQAGKLVAQLQQELDEDQKYSAYYDRRVFLIHIRLAQRIGAGVDQDLIDRYRFHLELQKMHKTVVQALNEATWALNSTAGREMSAEEFAYLKQQLNNATEKLFEVATTSKRLHLPALKNMEAGQRLRDFLLPRSVIDEIDPSSNNISAEWIQQFLMQINEVQDKVKRLLFKSLGAILAAQEKIVVQSGIELPDPPQS